jgi:hypothetical protein
MFHGYLLFWSEYRKPSWKIGAAYQLELGGAMPNRPKNINRPITIKFGDIVGFVFIKKSKKIRQKVLTGKVLFSRKTKKSPLLAFFQL